jgi:hypothetical protein
MAAERLDTGSPDGCNIGGASTDLVAFYGSDPVAQASAITTISAAASFTTVVTAMASVLTALRNLGLIAT